MFKQVKSAVFWYYLYKFRKRLIVIFLLLLIALFANAIYYDIVEYLKLKNKLNFLELILIAKWVIILFNITFSIYLILTFFKFNKKENNNNKTFSFNENKNQKTKNNKEENTNNFTNREKEFLYKKIRNKAEITIQKNKSIK